MYSEIKPVDPASVWSRDLIGAFVYSVLSANEFNALVRDSFHDDVYAVIMPRMNTAQQLNILLQHVYTNGLVDYLIYLLATKNSYQFEIYSSRLLGFEWVSEGIGEFLTEQLVALDEPVFIALVNHLSDRYGKACYQYTRLPPRTHEAKVGYLLTKVGQFRHLVALVCAAKAFDPLFGTADRWNP